MSPTQCGVYRVRVGSHLNPHLAQWLEACEVENCADGEAVLTTQPIDQAALHGLLARIRDLNLVLLSVQRTVTGDRHE